MIYILDVNENIVAVLSNDNPGACPYYKDSWKERLDDALITYDFSAPMDHENSKFIKNDGYIIRESPSGVLTLLQIIETDEGNIDDMPVIETYTENSGLELLGNTVDPVDYKGRSIRESAAIALTGTRWEIGRIDWLGNVKDLKIDDFETSLAVIQEIAKDVKAELQFRVEINPDKSISRYIDFLERRGVDTAKRYEHGHDLIEVRRRTNRATVATAIIPIGKGGEGGDRLTIENIEWKVANGDPVDKPLGQNWIGDEEARMRWGNGGLHIKKKLDTNLEDPARLIQTGWDEVQVKKEASTTYEMKVLFFRDRAGYADEDINIGDGIEVFDPTFFPELLLYARILEYDISFTDPEESELVFGNYRILKSNINATLRAIQSTLIRNEVVWTQTGTKITTGPDMPTNPEMDDFWLDTSDAKGLGIDVLRRFDGFGWVPATPTEADQISESTGRKWAAESGANVTENNISADTSKVAGEAASVVKEKAEAGDAAKTKLDVEVGTGVIETVAGSEEKAGTAEQNAISYTVNNAERKVYVQATQPTGIIENGYKWIDTSDPTVDIWKVLKNGVWVEIGRSDLSQLSGQIESAQIKTGAVLNDKLAGLAVTLDKMAVDSVSTDQVVSRSLSGAKIALDAITNDLMAVDSVTASEVVNRTLSGAKIALDAITNDLMAIDAIGTSEIQSRALTSAKIALDNITNDLIATNAITNDLMADNSISTAEIVGRSMTSAKIALSNITNDLMAVDSVGTTNIVSRAMTSAKIALDNITNDLMAVDAIGTNEIQSRALTSEKIALDNITNDLIATSAITNDLMADNSVGTAEIVARSMTSVKIALDNITNDLMAVDAIGTSEIQSRALTSAKIALDAVTNDLIANAAITNDLMALNSVGTGQMIDRAMSSVKIALDAITNDLIAADAITNDLIADNAVNTENVVNRAMSGVKIALLGVTAAEMANTTISAGKLVANTLTANEIAANAINTSEIAANAVIASKITGRTITAGLIAADTLTAYEIAAATITGTQIAGRTVTADKIVANAITANEIAANAITADEIAANAVTANKILAGSIQTDHIVSTGIDAKVITAGTIGAQHIAIGSNTTFEAGFNPAEKVSVDLPYSTSNTAGTESGKWTRVAQAYIYARYAAVNFSMKFSGLASGDPEKRFADVGFRIKQQAALGGIPKVEIAYMAGQEILASHFKVIATSMTTWETILDIYVNIPFIYEEYFFGLYDRASISTAGVYGLHDEPFLTAVELPTGTVWDGKDLSHNPTTNLVNGWQHLDTTYIAGGSIYTNSITTNQIAVRTITANKLYANSVTSDEIAANAINTNEIAARVITADKIVANAITANEIAANAITADEIAANAVTAGKILAGSIQTDHIISTGIDAKVIKAGVIGAQHVAIGSGTTFADGFDPTKIEIGGLNILKDSHQMFLSGSDRSANTKRTHVDGVTKIEVLVGGEYWNAYRFVQGNITDDKFFPSVAAGEVYTISFDVKYTPVNANSGIYITLDTRGPGGPVASNLHNIKHTNGRWVRFSGTLPSNIRDVQSSALIMVSSVISNDQTVGDIIEIRKIKIEKGNKSSEWTPNPADTTAEIAGAVKPANDRIALWQHLDTTYIAGGSIYTNSITANEIAANGITASEITGRTITADKIVAGSLTANELAANSVAASEITGRTITADKLVADTLTAYEIAARTITAAQIVTGTLTANELAANSVAASEIVGRSITADKLVANSITANEIAANAITADEIAANAVTATKILAGSIQTDHIVATGIDAKVIKAGVIGAEHVAIGSGTIFENGFNPKVKSYPNGLIFNDLAYISGGNNSPSTAIIRTNIHPGAFMTRVDITGYVYTGGSETLDLSVGFYAYGANQFTRTGYETRGKTAVKTVRLGYDTNNKVCIIVDFIPSLLSYPKISVTKAQVGHTTPPASVGDGWTISLSTDLTGITLINTPPGKDYNESHDLTKSWQHTDTTYIAGGAIYTDSVTANQIAANAITVNELAADAVTAIKIVARTVTADKIVANSLTAGEIATNAITADEIAGRTITAAQIATGTLTANELAANSVAASEIVGRSITADKLVANSITAGEMAANSIAADEITGRSITADKIVANSLTAYEIAASAIATDELAANAVTAAKVLANQISSNHIVTTGLSAEVIKFGVMDGARISVQYLSALSSNIGTVTAGTIDGALYRSGTGTDATLRMESGFLSMMKRIADGSIYMYTDIYLADGALTLEYSTGSTEAPIYTAILSPDDLIMSTQMGRTAVKADLFEMRYGTDITNPTNKYAVSMTDTETTVYSQDQMKFQAGSNVMLLTTSDIQFNGGKYTIASTGIPYTTQQESGHMGIGGPGNAQSVALLVGVNFRTRKTYTPSSISYTTTASNRTPSFYDISTHGFSLGIPSGGTSGGFLYFRGIYTA